MRENVARLRQLLSEAVPDAQKSRGPSNSDLFVIDASPRAKAEREITRIATWYCWQTEVIRFLDNENALTLGGLSIDAIYRLLVRVQKLEDCVREGLDPPDCVPAR